MKRAIRIVAAVLAGALGVVAILAALFGWYVWSPDADVPPLSSTPTRGTIDVAGVARTYRLYVPRGLPAHAPLVVVMHGSGESGAQIRMETGYGFDRLADAHGFAVVYPDSKSFDWNDCSRTGDFVAGGHEVDDVAFLLALVDRLAAERDLDRDRVFATGVSAGGFMAIRLAVEAPSRFRAVAAVSAAVPAPDNFKCRPVAPGTSVMLIAGTKDPIVPFDGGEVSLFGLFYKGGRVLSSPASARWFTDVDRIDRATEVAQASDDATVERHTWHDDRGIAVEQVTVVGGGHGLPQAAWRRPRLLGPSPTTPDGPALIWDFFARQPRRGGD